MTGRCDVAIIGAGPYGLSLAAHLSARGINFRIFGKALDSWAQHMPKNMNLKSDGFASSLSAPFEGSRLEDYCARHGLPYDDELTPVPLDRFIAYARDFRARFVPNLEEKLVTSLKQDGDGFRMTLDSGETVEAGQVVLAVGVTSFAHTPDILSHLPRWAASHTFDHRDASYYKDKDVIVIGGGASSVGTAWLFHEDGANTIIVARDERIEYHTAPDPGRKSILDQIQRPSSGIGPGWRSFLCVNAPLVFHRMPEKFRLRVVRRHLGPAAGWYMRDKVEGVIPKFLDSHLVRAETTANRRVALTIADSAGREQTLSCDHVVAGTGFRPDLRRLPFLDEALRHRISHLNNTPNLSDQFEMNVPGLYAVGPLAANAFGPLMRFMFGAEFAAPRLSAQLARRLGARVLRRAA